LNTRTVQITGQSYWSDSQLTLAGIRAENAYSKLW
jgi:hypothetical protein